MKTFSCLGCLCILCFLSVGVLKGEEPVGARPAKPIVTETLPTTNSACFVDVTRVDGVLVKEPIIASPIYQEDIATRNTARMKAIMSSPAIGEYCRIHFPAGSYYFNGAAEGWKASIQTTARNQSITGDGVNATRIIQKSTEVYATVKISHSNCTIQNLSIMSADYQPKFNREWDTQPHQTAILLETLATNPPWHTDPQILNVNINATGNNITMDGFYRPFKIGIKSLGPWLNIYAQSMFIQHVHNAIYINQGSIIAGPAKFIDINSYATAPVKGSQTWNTFFKSEGHFMEQVELIHCTYIGSQFIYMDGTKFSPDDVDFSKTPTNPVYNMLIDHCYINSLWYSLPSGDPKWSSIYFNLPPKPGGINPSFGSELYSKKIIFTYNWCAGKSPRDGAFFYVEGNLKGLTIHGNDFASGGRDRCIYIRATQPLLNSDVAVRDIEITNNYFNDFRNPVTIGGNKYDPSRVNPSPGYQESNEQASAATGRDDDTQWVEGVMITGNQTFYLPNLEKTQLTGLFLNRVRQVTVSGNKFAKTNGSSVIMRQCEDIILNGNSFAGFTDDGECGIYLLNSRNATLTGNMLRGFKQGIFLQDSQDMAINGNNVFKCQTALELRKHNGAAIAGNMISEAKTSMRLSEIQNVAIVGNTYTRSGAKIVDGNSQSFRIKENIGLAEK